MLASLFRGNSSQRSSQHIESVTDETHTRSLLFGQSQHVLNLTASPPPSPFGSPAIKPSSFDDHGGLELEEKDIRVLLAQDAHGSDERPTLLFDSKRSRETELSSAKSPPRVKSPLPPNWGLPSATADKTEDGSRNRSSTFSGDGSSWSKARRDLAPKDDPFLECMFGVTSSTKTATSTKMHIIPARSRQMKASERLPRKVPDDIEQRRALPNRAQTAAQPTTLSILDESNKDSLLITRLFHVSLDETAKVAAKVTSPDVHTADKPRKLVERKVPAFAVGFVLQLPYPSQRPHSTQSRPAANPSYGQSFTSATSSYGSDMQSSWTFLDAIPASLSSSLTLSDGDDRRLDAVVDNWDVILRSISCFERAAARVVNQNLQIVLDQIAEPQNKPPKEKSMQRVNQRMVAIHDVAAIAKAPSLALASADVSRRIVYAIRIPRVLTGLGFTAGHWIDEARVLHRTCGGKQQNFFLFNLLTAFLGNHMQWLERLAPEWYRKQFQAMHRGPRESRILASRTVIVSEQKGLARRLIYILASFLPGRCGIDGIHRLIEGSTLACSCSSSGHVSQQQSPRRPSRIYASGNHASVNPAANELGTSVSPNGSHTSIFINHGPRAQVTRSNSSTVQFVKEGLTLGLEGRSGAGVTSAIMQQAAQTPTAYISALRDSYFPENAIVETNDSIATTDLSKVLSKAASVHRRTSSVSSKWGSLVSGISDIWSNKQSTPGDRGSITTSSQNNSPANQQRQAAPSAVSIGRGNTLQMMVDELGQRHVVQRTEGLGLGSQDGLSPPNQSARVPVAAPRLHVDDKDGVVDVELDLPGFVGFTNLSSPQHQSSKNYKKPIPFCREGTDSACSMRSSTSKTAGTGNDEHINVGGYLRRHHEDFVLHAVRPYNELWSDIKRFMKAEPTPQELLDQILLEALPSTWISVCTTLVADTKHYTIHRLTLRRRYEVKSPQSASGRDNAISAFPTTSSLALQGEEIVDEVVMEFDTTLTDAVEKVLSMSAPNVSHATASSRTHSRNISTSSSRVEASPAASVKAVVDTTIRPEINRAGHRDLVVGALEDVVKSVNDDLNRESQQPKLSTDQSTEIDEPRQENALREGVKKWLRNVEQTSVW